MWRRASSRRSQAQPASQQSVIAMISAYLTDLVANPVHPAADLFVDFELPVLRS